MKRTKNKLELIARKIENMRTINIISARDNVSIMSKKKEIEIEKEKEKKEVDGYLCVSIPTSIRSKNAIYYL